MDKLTGSLVRLAAAYPQANVPKSTIDLYRSKLSICDHDGIVEAIESAIESSPRFPSIAELRQAYTALMLRRPQEDEAPALPLGRAPMPDEVREQIRKLNDAFAERSAEIDA